jgi:hypothetical protein
MLMALTRYSLVDHVLSDDAFTDDLAWTRMDAVILCWLTNTISADLQEVVREHGHPTRHLWLALENQFLSNHETRTLHLDAAFRNIVQGDLFVTEYCRKFKGMDDALAYLGSPVDDRILILNILHDLNQRFKHLGAIIRRVRNRTLTLIEREDDTRSWGNFLVYFSHSTTMSSQPRIC